MTDDERISETEAERTEEAVEQNERAENAENAAADDAQARVAELERLLAAERDAATDYMQRWQRAVADFTNFKRRAQQELEQQQRIVAAQALAPVLNALDSFERAFAALPESLRSYSWIDGLALVEYQLRRALEAQEIQEVAAEPGQAFDPVQHQAVGEVETDQHPAGHIAVVLQRGYQTAGLLLRPALVQVARPPAAKAEAERAEGEPVPAEAAPEETQPSGPAP